jgi:DNA-binding MarR family transcriptional regulator
MPTQHYRVESYRVLTSVGYLLKRAHSLLVEHIEPHLEARGLTFTQWVVLMHLREGLALNATVLCAQLRHDSGALTRILDQLERRGMVQRERSRRDRRAVQLHLTEQGRAIIEALIPSVVEQLNGALQNFSTNDLAELTRLLHKFADTLEAPAGTGSAVAAVPDGETHSDAPDTLASASEHSHS